MQAKRPVPLKQTETQGNNKRFGFPLHLVAARNVDESSLTEGIHTQPSTLNTGTQLESPVGDFKTVAIVIAYGRTSQLHLVLRTKRSYRSAHPINLQQFQINGIQVHQKGYIPTRIRKRLTALRIKTGLTFLFRIIELRLQRQIAQQVNARPGTHQVRSEERRVWREWRYMW